MPKEDKAKLHSLGSSNNRYIYFSQECEFTWTGFEDLMKRLLPDIASSLLLQDATQHTSHGRKWQFWSNDNGEPCFVVSRNNGIAMDDLHKLTAEFKGYIAVHSGRFPMINSDDGWDGSDVKALRSNLEELEKADSREFLQTTIKLRRGQQAFRQLVLSEHGEKCLITGCSVKDVLEAAHIKPYRGPNDHNIKNALLLRADIHILFDLNFIAIEPRTLRVHLHPSLKDSSYADLHEAPLQVPQDFSFLIRQSRIAGLSFKKPAIRIMEEAKLA